MKLNCKPGDLAVMVSAANPANVGGLVRVLHADKTYPGCWQAEVLSRMVADSGSPCFPGERGSIPDHRLRPIRDNDGEDETLTWKDVPAPAPTRAPTPQEVS